jgi:hypothetical protein
MCLVRPGISILSHAALATEAQSADIQAVFQELRKVLGEIPILASEQVCMISSILSCDSLMCRRDESVF